MSFDVYLDIPACSHCGREKTTVYEFNLTHNVNGIVDACFVAAGAPIGKSGHYHERSWGRLEGWSAEEALPIVERAAAESRKPERVEEFRKMETANGWGTLDVVRKVFDEFVEALRKHPKTVISTWG